jgi:hypothetical protein
MSGNDRERGFEDLGVPEQALVGHALDVLVAAAARDWETARAGLNRITRCGVPASQGVPLAIAVWVDAYLEHACGGAVDEPVDMAPHFVGPGGPAAVADPRIRWVADLIRARGACDKQEWLRLLGVLNRVHTSLYVMAVLEVCASSVAHLARGHAQDISGWVDPSLN